MQVDPGNSEQFSLWDGDQGEIWAARAERFDEGVAGYQEKLLAAAEISPSAVVLDIGCGSGQTSRDAARRASAGTVLGVDLSSRGIELARKLADQEGIANATFTQADAQVFPFPDNHFDVAISRHGVMFFADPVAAFTNVARALRAGGRLAMLTWQPRDRNEWIDTFRTILAPHSESPPPRAGSCTDPDQTRDLLTSAGFTSVEVTGLRQPMYFGRDVDDAHRFIAGVFAKSVEPGSDALVSLRASMADHLTDRGVFYDSAAWLITARTSHTIGGRGAV
jgi:ubiquinone/menaquinone biosynthesis C-methylase UbiE